MPEKASRLDRRGIMVQYKNIRLGAAETERKVSKSRAVWGRVVDAPGAAIAGLDANPPCSVSKSLEHAVFDLHQVVKKREVLIALHRVGICTYETCTLRICVYAPGLNQKVALKAFNCYVTNSRNVQFG